MLTGEVENIFLADRMLGRLCRLLRAAGVDCEWPGMAPPSEVIRLAETGGRILITRDTRIIKRTLTVESIFIHSDHVDEQAAEFFARFGTGFLNNAFKRCIECNGILEPVARDMLPQGVPLYVRLKEEVFARCPSCGRFYWNGTHKTRMSARLLRITAAFTGR